jgi:hypothetical protein
MHRKQNLAWRIGDEVTMSLYHDLAKVNMRKCVLAITILTLFVPKLQ